MSLRLHIRELRISLARMCNLWFLRRILQCNSKNRYPPLRLPPPPQLLPLLLQLRPVPPWDLLLPLRPQWIGLLYFSKCKPITSSRCSSCSSRCNTKVSNTKLAASTRTPEPPSKPSMSFPSWDGEDSTKNDFLARFATYQKDSYFTGADWTRTLPGFEKQSVFLRMRLSLRISLRPRRPCFHPEFETDGFGMVAKLLSIITPTSRENRLLATIEFGNLSQGPSETIEDYLARCRDLALRL